MRDNVSPNVNNILEKGFSMGGVIDLEDIPDIIDGTDERRIHG